MFLATRNFATCYSLGAGVPIFSRYSPLMIEDHLSIPKDDFDVYVRARILSTRGYGEPLSNGDINRVNNSAHAVIKWMGRLTGNHSTPELRHERV